MAHDELVLEHYGVKGMKWGVRKGGKTLISATNREKKRESNTKEMILNTTSVASLMFLNPVVGLSIATMTNHKNIKNAKNIIKESLGESIEGYNRKSLNAAARALNRYGETHIGEVNGGPAKKVQYKGL